MLEKLKYLKRCIKVFIVKKLVSYNIINNKSKRLVVISSLLSTFKGDRVTIDEKKMVEINKELSLCQDVRAMNLPFSMGDELWLSDLEKLEKILNEPDNETMMDKLYEEVPEWLKYPREMFAHDLALIKAHMSK